MTRLNAVRLAVFFPAIFSFAGCSSQSASPGSTGIGGGATTGGATQSTNLAGGTMSSGGASQTTGATSAGTGGSATATGGSRAQAGSSSTGGSITGATGGTTATTTSSVPTGGKTSSGGTSATGTATGGNTATTGGTTGSPTGGKTSTGGTTTVGATGGMPATGGSVAATGGATADQNGKTLAKVGDKTSAANDYLNLGTMRLINNNWGSVALSNCSAPMSVSVTSSTSLTWTFNRGNCGDDGSHPDYPELEFGVAPFGKTSALRTTPPFSTTSMLPIQVKNIQSASVSIGNFAINLQNNTNWNLNIEFWLSKLDPLTNNDAQAYAEIMGLWGMSAGAQAWKCNVTGQSVSSGGKTYNLCHQSDTWGTGGTWRFFQFQASSLSQSFSGTVDVKAFLDWFYNSSYGSGVSKDYYLTRIEIGSEIDDTTSGSCTLSNVSFTINGTTQSPILAQ
jgi:hypothetical protein